MKNNILKFDKCANCGACYNVCPVDAITVNKDTMFYECKVDEEKCINCGKCMMVCPLNNQQNCQDLKAAIGGWSKDRQLVSKSSSGGVFSIIADYVLKDGGIVFGAVFSDDFHSVYIAGTNEVEIDKIRRSKYVESDVRFVFREIKKHLNEKKKVLFCGTPCQVAGLKRYLDKEYGDLITCDFACGGLPSHKIYHSYLTELEKHYKASVCSVNFRSGIFGWSTHFQSVDFDNGAKYKKLAFLDSYFYSFIHKHTTIRPNCLDCQFMNNHYSDIILADFWKWDSVSTLKSDDTGISLVIANSNKGLKLFDVLKEKMEYEELDLINASYNCRVEKSGNSDVLKNREVFFDVYVKSGVFEAAKSTGLLTGINAKKYCFRKKLSKIKQKLGNSK